MLSGVTEHAPTRYDGGIVFGMPIQAGSVVVRVSNEALDSCEQSSSRHGNRLSAFHRNRYAIEGVARRKLMLRRAESDGSILVTTDDLNG